MGECQVPYAYDEDTISALKASLSEPRFSKYLTRASGNELFAIEIYLYKVRLAKAFLFPLGVAEVVLRNAVDDVLVQTYGANWHQDETLRSQVLTAESLAALDKAIQRVGVGDRGKVIAELTFDFWSNLFRTDYAGLWRTKANIAFPGLARGEGRHEIQLLVKEINRFRNRVAHHEPILDVNAPDLQSKMIKLTNLRCPKTSDWMRHHTMVNIVMRSKPSLKGSAPVSLLDRSDPRFLKVEPSMTLLAIASDEAKSLSAFVCVDGGVVVGAFTYKQFSHFVSEKALAMDGMIDLKDHKISDLIKDDAVKQGCRILPGGISFLDAVKTLKEPKIAVIVAIDDQNNEPLGVILRAYRRY
ncbi:hypothetical protein [Hwanghaeella sp. 1Z406]|uniref:hypothetical protein n=1 Tax=Hwanghaeella sp. 1Z406 TaxID=3402811 RepID=UPI003B67D23F